MRGLYTQPPDQLYGGGNNEYLEFVKAWGSVTLSFAIFLQPQHNIFRLDFLLNLFIAALTCGVAIVLHELAHRVVARLYGAQAHFAASPTPMLVVPIFLAFVGLFIAAPGAVWPRGHLTQKQIGYVAVAGPVTNLVLAVVFFGLQYVLLAAGLTGILLEICAVGYYINAWLGLFNMIPVDPFDGAKVLRWDKVAFGVVLVAALFAVFGLPGVF